MRYVIVAGIVMALAIINGSFAEREEQILIEALQAAQKKKAELVAACLNGKSLQEGDHIVDCKPRKK